MSLKLGLNGDTSSQRTPRNRTLGILVRPKPTHQPIITVTEQLAENLDETTVLTFWETHQRTALFSSIDFLFNTQNSSKNSCRPPPNLPSYFLKIYSYLLGRAVSVGYIKKLCFWRLQSLLQSFSLKCPIVRVKKFMTVFPVFTRKDASQYLIQWCS